MTTLLYHGSSVHLKQEILQFGLKEPVPGRGCWVTPDRSLAITYAMSRSSDLFSGLLVTLDLPDDAPIQPSVLAGERFLPLAHLPAAWISNVEVVQFFPALHRTAEQRRAAQRARRQRTAERRRRIAMGEDRFAAHMSSVLHDEESVRDLVSECWEIQLDSMRALALMLSDNNVAEATEAVVTELARSRQALRLLGVATERESIDAHIARFRTAAAVAEAEAALTARIEAGVAALPPTLLAFEEDEPDEQEAELVKLTLALLQTHAAPTALFSIVHGIDHWLRVSLAAKYLLERTTGAERPVVLLFCLLHDSQRINDGDDPEHGQRAADSVRRYGSVIGEPRHQLLLQQACALHADGMTTDDPTLAVCWDADRLCLHRVGITPDPALMSTEAGRDPQTIEWARQMQSAVLPDWLEIGCALLRPAFSDQD